MDKLFIVALIVGGLVIAGLGVAVKILRSDLKAAETSLTLKTQELKDTKGDLDVSKQNYDRMMAEKDALIDVYSDRAADQQERANQFARISKDIAHAVPASDASGLSCADSAPVAAAVDGLRNLQRSAGGDQSSNDRISAGQDSENAPALQGSAGHP